LNAQDDADQPDHGQHKADLGQRCAELGVHGGSPEVALTREGRGLLEAAADRITWCPARP
jgi:hypothetical protein